MPFARQTRLRLMPWIAVFITLGLTLVAVKVRSDAVDRENAAAAEAADGHFDAVVAETASRTEAAVKAYERILISSVSLMDSPISPLEVESRLEILDANSLPGIRGFAVFPAGATEPTWIGEELPIDFELQPLGGAPGYWFAISDSQAELAAFGFQTPEGDLITTITVIPELLHSSGASHQEHGFTDTLTTSSVTAAPVSFNSQTPVRTMSDMGAPAGDTDFKALRATQDLTLFGQPWQLNVESTEGFLTIPASGEIPVLTSFGVLLSLALFALLHFLVSSLNAQSSRRDAEDRFAAGFNSSALGFAVLDGVGEVLEANEAMAQMLSTTNEQLVGRPMANVIAQSNRNEWRGRVLLADASGTHCREEVCYSPEGESGLWVDETVTVVISHSGERNIFLQLSDVTAQRDARNSLQHRAQTDELTGLANRSLLEERLDEALLDHQATGTSGAVMFIDVDQFKMINDSLGHRTGDLLLAQLAARLQRAARGSDTLARFGGDEFIMLCQDLSDQTDIWRIAERIRAETAAHFCIEGKDIGVTLSIGIAVFGEDDTVGALLRDSDLAMFKAKQAGRNRVVLFEDEMRSRLIAQRQLDSELVTALAEDQLELFYQPLIRVTDRAITGFEALARWRHPERGIVAPDMFLPAAERLGLLQQIDAWALNTATTQLAEWSAEIPSAAQLTVAVNASPANFGNPAFATAVADAIERAGLDSSRITIEITEEAFLQHTDTAKDVIDRLRNNGTQIALDDFGTGYSSLGQLASLDIDMLKIDKSFLKNLHESPSTEIVQAVVDMSHALGIPTVAEGVETEEDLAKLREIGATRAQGYLISRPVPPEEAKLLLESSTASVVYGLW